MAKTISSHTYTTGYTLTSTLNSPLTIASTGKITANGTTALYAHPGATNHWTIINSGVISAGTSISDGNTLDGSGIILGGDATVAGAVVSNMSGGTISAAGYGILINATTGAVTNFLGGTITAAGNAAVEFESPGTAINYGVILNSGNTGLYSFNGGLFINKATGTIKSGGSVNSGVVVEFQGTTPGTFENAGVINDYGITGNAAVYFYVNPESTTNTADRLIVDPGASFVGGIKGGRGVLELKSGASAGTLSGFGTTSTGIVNFATLAFDTGADWTVIGAATNFVATTIIGGSFPSFTTTITQGIITGFTTNDTIELTGFVATSETFSGAGSSSGQLVLTNAASQHSTLNIQGSFSTSSFAVTNNGTNTTIALQAAPSILNYGTTIVEDGIVATSETVSAGGILTLFNAGATAVGTINVGTSLATGDFLVTNNGTNSTVVLNAIFGTYASGVTLLTNPTTVNSTAQVSNNTTSGVGLTAPAGTADVVTVFGTVQAFDGIELLGAGDVVSNMSGGYIHGGAGVYIKAANDTVVNAGRIIGQNGTVSSITNGIELAATSSGAVITNLGTGTISGGGNAIYGFAGETATIVNYGLLTMNGTHNFGAVALYGGGTVVNKAGGIINANGEAYGIKIKVAGTITNAGTIEGTGTVGVISAGSLVANDSGGVITGNGTSVGIFLTGSGTVINAGTIDAGTSTSDAVQFAAAAGNRLIDYATGVFSGIVNGGTTSATLELHSGASTGTVTGLGVSFTNFGTVQFDTGADWLVKGASAGVTSVAFNSFASGDTIDVTNFVATTSSFSGNHLTLTSGGSSITIDVPGTFTTGNFAISSDGTSGTDIELQAAPTILNYGTTIVEAGIVAISETVNAGGTLTLFNAGSTAVGTINVGTSLSTGDFTVTNNGTNTNVILTSIFGTYTSGVTLLTDPTKIDSQAKVGNTAASGTAVSGPSGTTWTVTNLGTVSETASNGVGIALAAVGTIVNASGGLVTATSNAIQFAGGGVATNQSGGTITGLAGVYINGAAGTVVNTGAIMGNAATTSGDGIFLNAGGAVTNQSGGTISGADGIYGRNAAVTVVNSGRLGGGTNANGAPSNGNGVALLAGGSITNQSSGVIIGAQGIYAKDGILVVNAGQIFGAADDANGSAVYLREAGWVSNQSGGTISGSFGVYMWAQPGIVINAGDIDANTYTGVVFRAGGVVTNQSGGTISGKGGITVTDGGSTTIVNAGSISGGSYGAVKLAASFTNLLVIDPGAAFTGAVNGGNTIGAASISTLELASGASAGTLHGFGGQYVNFGQITFDAGAQWDPMGNDATTALAGATISGFTYGDTIDVTNFVATGSSFSSNHLTLTSGGSSITLDLPGTFTTGNVAISSDGTSGTDIKLQAVPVILNYGTTLVETGIVATSETVNAGMLTLFNAGSTTVGTINVGTSLSTGDFTVTNNGTNTDVILTSIFGTYTSGVTLLTNPTRIDSQAKVSNAATSAAAVIGLTGTAWTLTNFGSVSESGSFSAGISLASGGTIINASGGLVSAASSAIRVGANAMVTNQSGGTVEGASGVLVVGTGSDVVNSGLISGSSRGVTFTSGGTVSNLSGGTIESASFAVVVLSGAASITNAGVIAGSGGGGGAGIYINDGGLVSNQSTGTISGLFGIEAITNAATVVNAGSVGGTGGNGDGVKLTAGGNVTNQSGGVISGKYAVLATSVAIAVINAGTVAGGSASGAGVELLAGGTVTNQSGGLITGGTRGIYMFGGAGTVSNAGSIGASLTNGVGVFLGLSGSVTNASGGGISGGNFGVYLGNAAGTVSNAGRIAGTTVAGVLLNHGGTFSNVSGGTVTGGAYGVEAQNAAGTASNAGFIYGTTGAGVYLQAGGTLTNQSGGTIAGATYAVKFHAGYSGRLVIDPGAVFVGTVNGENTIGASSISTLELASGASTGTLSGLGSKYINFAQITLDSGATWSLTGANTVATGVTVAVVGTLIDAGSLTNSGTIAAGTSAGVGVSLAGNGSVSNQSGGVISGHDGIVATGTAATVVNYGQILGNAAYGIDLTQGGTVIDVGTISGGPAAVAFGGTSAGVLELENGYSLHGVQGSASAQDEVLLVGTTASAAVTATYNSLGLVNVGTIGFATSTSTYATWTITNDATLPGTIANFTGTSETIDLTGFSSTGLGVPVFNTASHQLTITNNTTSVSLQLGSGSYTGITWTAIGDGHGGTDITVLPAPPPVVLALAADVGVANENTIAPLSQVSISDPSGNGTVTATVTLSSTANGTLSNFGGGTYSSGTGIYSFTGSASAATSAIESLIFTPIAPASGVYVTETGFTVNATGVGGTGDPTTVTLAAVQQVLGLASVLPANIVFSVSPDGSSFAAATGGKTNEAVVLAPTADTEYDLPVGYQAEFLGGSAAASLIDKGVDNAVLVGNTGNDTIGAGAATNDSIVGGNGANDIFAGTGTVAVVAGSGNNTVSLPNGATYSVSLGGGNDTVYASGAGTINGGTGDNIFTTESVAGTNQINSDGSDVIYANGTLTNVSIGGSGAHLVGSVAGTVNATITAGAASVAGFGDTLNVTTSGGTGYYYAGASTLDLTDNGTNDTVVAGNVAITVSAAANSLVYGGSAMLLLTGGAGTPTVIGGSGGASITGGSGGVVVAGGSGTPTVSGAATLFGTSGGAMDYVGATGGLWYYAGDGSETLNAGSSSTNNVMIGSASTTTGADVITTGTGHDTVAAIAGTMTVNATASPLIYGGSAFLLVNGGTGTPTVVGGSGGASIVAGTGGVDVAGGTGTPTVSGAATLFGVAGGLIDYTGSVGGAVFAAGSGAETLDAAGSTTNNLMYGNSAAGSSQVFFGGLATDTVIAGAGSTTIEAGGQDLVGGGSGSLNFVGGTGVSTVFGGSGAASVTGGLVFVVEGGASPSSGIEGGVEFIQGAGAATLNGAVTAIGAAGGVINYVGSVGDLTYYAASGAETINASQSSTGNMMWAGASSVSADVMLGGTGNDTMIAGAGASTMTGGGGSDVFIFLDGRDGGTATITDFASQDVVDLLGYGSSAASAALSGAVTSGSNTTVTLTDNTQITFLGVSSVSQLTGHVFSS